MVKQSAQFLFLVVSAFVLGVVATGFGWVIYLIVGDRLPKGAEIYVAEEYVPANIVVNTVNVGDEVLRPWAAFAQGGEEAGGGMLAGTEEKMKRLRPEYVRLDHIFDDDYYGVVRRDGGSLQYDFSKLDAIVEDITEMGAKPFFSLSYMPSEIAENKIAQPRDWNEWKGLVKATIRHYSGSAEKNIAGVYYEVWNEPDLESFGKWHYGGGKSYLELYNWSAQAARELRNEGGMNEFKFGGSGITALYRNWVVALTSYARGQGLPLDFLSWHRYAYDPDAFTQDLNDMDVWLGSNHGYELVISEWGPDPGKTPIYGGRFAGAHAVATTRQMLGRLDWGFAFEIKDGPGQQDFGWGVLKHNEAGLTEKPRYYAFLMMEDMSGPRLEVTGEGSNVTAWAVERDGKYQVIVANYHPQGSGAETVPVRFGSLNNGQYKLTWQSLSGVIGDEMVVVSEGFYSRDFDMQSDDVLKVVMEPVQVVERLGRNLPENYQEISGTGFGMLLLGQ